MDTEQFDQLVRQLVSNGSRRRILHLGITAGVTSVLSGWGLHTGPKAIAKKGKGKGGSKGKGGKKKKKKGSDNEPVCGRFPTFTGQECPPGSDQRCCEAPSSLEENFDVCCPAGWGRPYGCCIGDRERVCCPPDNIAGCCEVACCQTDDECSGGRACIGFCCLFP